MKQIGVKNVKLSEYEMSIAAHLVDPLNMHVCIVNLIEDFFFSCILCQGSQRPQPGLKILEGITGFSIVMLTDMIHYKRIKGNINKERGSGDEVWRKSGTSFQESSPSEVTQDALDSSSNTLRETCKMLSTREAH